jgi:hypothetical protein
MRAAVIPLTYRLAGIETCMGCRPHGLTALLGTIMFNTIMRRVVLHFKPSKAIQPNVTTFGGKGKRTTWLTEVNAKFLRPLG